ncbi:MAG: efflux RND transporter periplasmic adaptor subunit [Candidatus Devosia phytovorans]|uniref:Efflux RND transporter periplasmic adaptor subunit n=1 Tax=Candidatus Devosia phytovorans TaxID=3121372 RepID=A0AAJ5VXP0_9HYPH|nr:efflux RND transporter periplasmic adaptor subunit [Devosia sp.]WEK06659.1 MAG: efflux RND transporter periplasmic adaptor subunit [Devosia sp.]
MQKLALTLAMLMATTAPSFAQFPGGAAATGPIEVGVITLQPESTPITTVLPGRVIASATADVRPQVGGVVTEVQVREGQRVEAGAVIAKVDPATYEADVAVAEAALVSAQAQVPTAQATVERYQTLNASGGISRAELDTALVTLAQAQAAVTSAEAQLRVANLTLERSTITAPISGVLGTINVQVGSLLTASQTEALTTIRQVDPVDITLVESSANLLSARQSSRDRQPPSDTAEPPRLAVTLTLEDGSSYDQEGSVSSMDMVVSETTGTFTLQASMPNPDRVLLPGMFVRATISFGDQDGIFLVPQRAVTFNEDGLPTAYFVGADKTVEQHVLAASRVVNNAWVVTDGITAGDQLIVDGLQKIEVGTAISPLEVTMEANGVIYQEAPAVPSEGAAPAEGAN